jgi:diaminopimelate epimerase
MLQSPMTHSFRRYTGAGNTFIVMDSLSDPLGISRLEMELLVRAVCDPQTGPGADGVILVNDSQRARFRMDFYNPDGSTGMLCGNGARCAVQAARDWGYVPTTDTDFEVLSAVVTATLLASGEVRVRFQDPNIIDLDVHLDLDGKPVNASYIDLGSQHLVIPIEELTAFGVKDIESMNVAEVGPHFRNHSAVMPKGANANFIEVQSDGDERYIRIRTFERGVEAETLACGTGCMSAAISAYFKGDIATLPIRLKTQSEEFVVVNFERHANPAFVRELTLQGSAIGGEQGVLLFDEATGSLSVRYD